MTEETQLQQTINQTDTLVNKEVTARSEQQLAANSVDVIDESSAQYERRFKGTQTLYGASAVDTFAAAHVYVIGVGGVGSWAAEALARTAVGTITLIDLDILVASNVNRQLPALDSTFGQSKIAAMATRIREINPKVKINLIDDFLTPENVAALLPMREQAKMAMQKNPIVILDCVDDMNAKLALALHCRFNKLKLIMAGGAGGKTDPTQIQVADLKDTYQDPLLAKVRQRLRQDYGINRAMKEKFGIRCVFSSQPPIVDKSCQTGGLHCGGYGSAVAVTSVVGMMLVAEALK